MQAQDAKYKKWGWGALIGLAAVIVIAGLAVAISMSAPKKTIEADKASTGPSSVASNTGNSNSDKSDNKDEGREDNDKGDTDGTDGTDGTNNSGNSNNSNNSSNSSNAGNTNSGNTNTASNMPKTGPEEDIASIIAWAAIAGLGAYYFLNAKKSA